MRKTYLMNMPKTKNAPQLMGAFVFTTYMVQSLYFLNPKFQASIRLLFLYSPDRVKPGRNPEGRFSHDDDHLPLPNWILQERLMSV